MPEYCHKGIHPSKRLKERIMMVQIEKEIKPGKWMLVLNVEDSAADDTLKHFRQYSKDSHYRLLTSKKSYSVSADNRTG